MVHTSAEIAAAQQKTTQILGAVKLATTARYLLYGRSWVEALSTSIDTHFALLAIDEDPGGAINRQLRYNLVTMYAAHVMSQRDRSRAQELPKDIPFLHLEALVKDIDPQLVRANSTFGRVGVWLHVMAKARRAWRDRDRF